MQLFLLSSILLIGAVDGRRLTDSYVECNENESLELCGSSYEPSCEHPIPTNCTKECISRCQCDKGFLRRHDKKCVHESQCQILTPPTTCPENERLNDCSRQYDDDECPILTANGFYNKPFSVDCFPLCTRKCICKEGLFRNQEGRCVEEADCRPPGYECKENDTFRIRGSVCEPSCRTPNTYMCSFSLFKTGCHCNPGFLRNPEGECVKEEDCPYEDPENKCKSVQCGPLSICVIHEGRPLCVPQSMMLSHVVEGLFEPTSPTTKSTKNQDGQCKKNEIFKTCKTNCSETKCVGQPKTCTEECNGSGCVCQEGFFRDIFGVCINEKNCSMQRKMIDYILKFRSLA